MLLLLISVGLFAALGSSVVFADGEADEKTAKDQVAPDVSLEAVVEELESAEPDTVLTLGMEEESQSGAGPVREAPSERDRVLSFLDKHVAGRSIHTNSEGKAGKGSHLTYHRTIRISDLSETKSATKKGLTFDIFTTTEHIDKEVQEGKETGVQLHKNRSVVQRVYVSERKSSGNLVGYAEVIFDSEDDSTGDASRIIIEKTTDHSLVMHESELAYSDLQMPDGTYEAVANDIVTQLKLEEDGTIDLDQVYHHFKVDPRTIDRTPVGTLEVDRS